MNRKITTALLSLGVVVGFGSGLLSLGCGAHRHPARAAAAACDRHPDRGAPDKAPADPAPPAEGSSSL